VPGISIHVVDVSRGLVAAGMLVEVRGGEPPREVATGRVGANGLVDCPALAGVQLRGRYEAVFHIAAYYRDSGIPLPAIPFLDTVTYAFGIDRPEQHYHLPMKFTPWGYSCFRGGA